MHGGLVWLHHREQPCKPHIITGLAPHLVDAAKRQARGSALILTLRNHAALDRFPPVVTGTTLKEADASRVRDTYRVAHHQTYIHDSGPYGWPIVRHRPQHAVCGHPRYQRDQPV